MIDLDTILKIVAAIICVSGGSIDDVTYTHLRPVQGDRTHD